MIDLTTPLNVSKIANLSVGDTVYFSGKLMTARDSAHALLLDNGMPDYIKPYSSVLYHCGPLVSKRADGSWDMVSAGPTTSMRMEVLEPAFIKRFSVSIIIGKGGMGPATLRELEVVGAVYLAYTGGAGALAAAHLKVVDVAYLEKLGMPEAIWLLEAVNFGPLVVGMDSHGESLYK